MAIDLVATLSLRDELTSSLKKVAGAATVGFAAVTGAAALSVNKFVEFDNAIRRAGAVAGANASELEQLSQAALDLGASTSKGAAEVAMAQGELAAGGFNVAQILQALPGVIAASEASGESLAVASDTVSSALSIWALEAGEAAHVSDVLAEAANASAAGISDLAYGFKYAGAPAAALGITLEETAAAIGLITNSGIDGSTAGTALRAALLALNNPAKAQQKIMDKLGLSVTDASGNFRSLSDLIRVTQKATEGLSQADKVATLSKLVGTEAVSGFLALVNAGPEGIDKFTDSLVNSGGASEETAKQLLGGIGGALEELSGAFETLQIRVGEAFADVVSEVADFVASTDFTPVIDGAVEIGEALFGLAKSVSENLGTINSVAGATAKAIFAVVGAITAFKLALVIGGAVTALAAGYRALATGAGLAAAAQVVFNGTLLANPIGLIALAIAGLVGVAILLWTNWDILTDRTKKVWDAIGGGAGFIQLVLGPLGILIGAAVDLATNWDNTRGVWEQVWEAIVRSTETSVNSAIGLINGLIGAINSIPFIEIPTIGKVDFGVGTFGPKSTTTNLAKPATRANDFGLSGTNVSGPRGLIPAANVKPIAPLPSRAPSTSTLGTRTPPGFIHGLANVPYDGFEARLHRNERVLTAQENKAYTEGQGGVNIAKLADQIIVREDADINRIADALVAKLTENRGGVTG